MSNKQEFPRVKVTEYAIYNYKGKSYRINEPQ